MTTKIMATFEQLNTQLGKVNMALNKTEAALVQIAEKQQSASVQNLHSMSQLLKIVTKPNGTIDLTALKEESDPDDPVPNTP
jgi:hypothetical protein